MMNDNKNKGFQHHILTNEEEEDVEDSSNEEELKENNHLKMDVRPVSIFDDEVEEHNHVIIIEELNDEHRTKMIKTQKQYEKYSKCMCGYKLFVSAWKIRLIIFNILFLLIGLMFTQYVVKVHYGEDMYHRVFFYVIYLSLLIFCVSVSKLLTWIIMCLLRKSIKNSWSVFYVRDITNRLYLTVLSLLWLITLYMSGNIEHYHYNSHIFAFVECVFISAAVFLFTYIFVRYIALTSYFDIFRQRARTLKAYVTFIEIMLDIKPGSSMFSILMMNFLINFPSLEMIKSAKKKHQKTVSFNLSKELIQKMQDEKMREIINSFENKKSDGQWNKWTNDENEIYDYHEREMKELINTDLYAIKLDQHNTASAVLINGKNNKKLDNLSRVLSYLIILRLNAIKKAEKRMSINHEVFIKVFTEYPKLNKDLLRDLGESAWIKFSERETKKLNDDKTNRIINEKILNLNISKIIDDLLKLKQTIDSYIIIIQNLQKTIDVLTPVLLLFVYLYVFEVDFKETITLYASSFAIIGFFGSTYFSSVFGSISFILTVNPYLVGDYIMYNSEVYRVEKISLISCIFRQMSNGYSYQFQNKVLGQSENPIINFSRSNNLKYKWTFYIKPSDMKQKEMYQFVNKCKKKIQERQKYEVKHNKESFCTPSELKSIDVNLKSLKVKAYELDEFGRKKLKVQMKYQTYCNDVQSLCFNCIAQVIKEEGYDCDPLRIIKQ